MRHRGIALHESLFFFDLFAGLLAFLPRAGYNGENEEKSLLMLTKEEFHDRLRGDPLLLDGATGSNLQAAGMPRGCCTEQWCLSRPHALTALQRAYAEAGAQIVYAPTFQAQPLALARVGLERETESVNARLVALSRAAAPECLIAGDLTTLAAFCDSREPANFDLLTENYRRQIRGLIDGGADLLIAETLLYACEAEAIFCAAELEHAGALLFSFPMQADGSLYSGEEAMPILRALEEAGAAAVGLNCVAADAATAQLVGRLHAQLRGPILCKPNAGIPVIEADGLAHYPMPPHEFAEVIAACVAAGARLVGGCCGTTPAHIRAVREALRR